MYTVFYMYTMLHNSFYVLNCFSAVQYCHRRAQHGMNHDTTLQSVYYYGNAITLNYNVCMCVLECIIFMVYYTIFMPFILCSDSLVIFLTNFFSIFLFSVI